MGWPVSLLGESFLLRAWEENVCGAGWLAVTLSWVFCAALLPVPFWLSEFSLLSLSPYFLFFFCAYFLSASLPSLCLGLPGFSLSVSLFPQAAHSACLLGHMDCSSGGLCLSGTWCYLLSSGSLYPIVDSLGRLNVASLSIQLGVLWLWAPHS